MVNRRLAVLVLLAAVIMTAAPFAFADDSSANTPVDAEDIHIHSFSDGGSVAAGKSISVDLVLFNRSADYTYSYEVVFTLSNGKNVSIATDKAAGSLDAGKSVTVTATADVASSAVSGTRTLTADITVRNVNLDTDPATASMAFSIKITTNYSSEGYYNKILGVFESPLDDAWATGIVNLAIWVGIAFGMDILLVSILLRAEKKEGKQDFHKDAKSAGWFFFILILMIGIPQSIRVSGMDETLIAKISDFINVLLCIDISYLVWKIYKIVAYNLIVKKDKDNRIDDSLYPLVKMVGKIVICVAAVSYILAIYGMDLGTIITSAGLVTLGISLGAQSTLNQFFCGLVLLVTRPFRIGDKVRLGNSTEVLIVRKIGVMETEFKVWLNEEVQHIPNSTVMGSNIVNITKNDKTYKVVDYIDIDYNADIDKAREIIMSILTSHPKIVNDGSKSRPDFRLSSMEDSSLRIRIAYIVYDHEVWHEVSCEVKEAIYKKFRVEGIKIPHNIVDVHME
jgi:small-conductance mechanosensitive channel